MTALLGCLVTRLLPVGVAGAMLVAGGGCSSDPGPIEDAGADSGTGPDVVEDGPSPADAGDADVPVDGTTDAEPDVPNDGSGSDVESEADAPNDGATEALAEDAAPDGPTGPNVCGDGWRDPVVEECDDGVGTVGTDRACTSACTVIDRLGANDGLARERRLGAGRHPVAGSSSGQAAVMLELVGEAGDEAQVAVHTFSAVGVRVGAASWSNVPLDADPVVAALPSGGFAVAYADFSVDGDGLGIAMAAVSGDGTPLIAAMPANETIEFGQHSPDILWTGSELVVGWEDESTIPRRICTQGFDEALAKLGDPSCTTNSLPVSRVSLASLQGQLVRAWRADEIMTTFRVELPGGVWTSDEVPPPPFDEAIALTELDAATMLAVFSDGAGELRAVAIDASGSELGEAALLNVNGSPRFRPALATTADGIFLGWREPAVPPDSGMPWDPAFDELWIQRLSWDGAVLDATAEPMPLPRMPWHQLGDQARPALAAVPYWPSGAVLAAWDDLTSTSFGAQSEHGDVVLELIPTPILRTPVEN